VFICLVVIGIWCLGFIRASEKHIWGRKSVEQKPEILSCEGKGCMSRRVVHLVITSLINQRSLPSFKSSNIQHSSPFQNPQAAQTTDSNLPYISPIDSPLHVSYVAHVRHPHMISSYLTLDISFHPLILTDLCTLSSTAFIKHKSLTPKDNPTDGQYACLKKSSPTFQVLGQLADLGAESWSETCSLHKTLSEQFTIFCW
jgi:hypothetical protein